MDLSLYIDVFDPFVDLFNATKSLLLDDSLTPLHIAGPHACVHELLLRFKISFCVPLVTIYGGLISG